MLKDPRHPFGLHSRVVALAVFVATLFLMIKRPRGLRLGYAAGIGRRGITFVGNGEFRAGGTVVVGHLGCCVSVSWNHRVVCDFRCIELL